MNRKNDKWKQSDKIAPWALIISILVIGLFFSSCQDDEINCSARGSHTLFIANFDNDIVGSPASPTAPLLYGPPRSSLNILGSASNVEVIDSPTLASKALKLVRDGNEKIIEMILGDIGDIPCKGIYYFEFRAHGAIIPDHLIAGTTIYIKSLENKRAVSLKLFEGAYHVFNEDAYVRLEGNYDPSVAHFVHIEIDLDCKKYAICINEEVVTANKDFIDNDFVNRNSLKIFIPPTITEAFQNVFVIDDIRVTK